MQSEFHHSLTCLSWHLRQFMTCHGYAQRYKIKQNCSFLQNICLPYVAVIGQFPEEFIIKPEGKKKSRDNYGNPTVLDIVERMRPECWNAK